MLSVTRSRASSLVETVIAIFVLIAGFLVVSRLFHTSLQFTTRANLKLTAARIAEKKVVEIQSWARDPNNWDANWDSDWPPTPLPDPDEPGFIVTVLQANQQLLSPCTSMEQRWVSLGKAKEFNNSYRRVTVVVNWSSDPRDELSVTTLVGDPPRQLSSSPVAISFPGGKVHPLAADASQNLEANLIDRNGRPIADVCFNWYVLPARLTTEPGGNAVLDTDSPATKRHGREISIRNRYPHPGGWRPIAGNVRALASSRYRGAEQLQVSDYWRQEE